MRIVHILRCDGRREYIERTMRSVLDNVRIDDHIVVNDSGDREYENWLEAMFPYCEFVHHDERQGLGACFQSALLAARQNGADFAFMTEDDTPLLSIIPVWVMARVLEQQPYLAQLMLMRPAFNAEEIAAGGVYQLTPDEFTECTDGQSTWVEHDRWFGFQPSLITRRVIDYTLAHATNFLELGVTEVLKPAGYRFGYWGALNDPPRCAHVGTVRSVGYRW